MRCCFVIMDEGKLFPPCIKIRATFYDKNAKKYYEYLIGVVELPEYPDEIHDVLECRLIDFQALAKEIWPYLTSGKTIEEFQEDNQQRYEV